MSDILRIKQRYGVPDNTKARQAVTGIIRSQVSGGNELINALTRLSEYLHNPRTRERDSLEAVKISLDEARTRLGDIFLAADDAAAAAGDALEIMSAILQRRERPEPILQEVHDGIEAALRHLDAPLGLTSDKKQISVSIHGRPQATMTDTSHNPAPESSGERIFLPRPEGKKPKGSPPAHARIDWSTVDYTLPSRVNAERLGVSVQMVNRMRARHAPHLSRKRHAPQ